MTWNSGLNTRKLADSLSEPTIRRGSSHNNRVYNAQHNSLSQKSHVSSKRRTRRRNFLWTTSSYFECDQLVGFTRRLTLSEMNQWGRTSECVNACSFAYLAGKWCNRCRHLFVPMPPSELPGRRDKGLAKWQYFNIKYENKGKGSKKAGENKPYISVTGKGSQSFKVSLLNSYICKIQLCALSLWNGWKQHWRFLVTSFRWL